MNVSHSKAESATAVDEWRIHWKLVLASAVGVSMAGIAIASLGVFMPSLEHAFAWKRAQISSGLTIFAICGVLFAPLLGAMIDKWGPRRFGIAGVLLCGATFAAFGTVTASIVHWLTLWAFFSVAAQVPRPMIWSAAVASEFTASRGLAMAVVIVGGGCGGILAPILANHLVDALGWRAAYTVMGLCWGGFAGLICYLFFYGRTDRIRKESSLPVGNETVLAGITAREGLRSATFVKLALSILLANTLYVALLVHMIPLLIGTGIARGEATWIVGLAAIASIMGLLVCGTLADRVPGNYLSAGSVSLLAVACALLLTPTRSVVLRVIPVVLVAITGGERANMLPYLTTRYFGLRAFGKIFGVVASFMAVAVGLGPVIAGYIYDRTHSYTLLLIAGVPIAVVGALLTLSLGRYPEATRARTP